MPTEVVRKRYCPLCQSVAPSRREDNPRGWSCRECLHYDIDFGAPASTVVAAWAAMLLASAALIWLVGCGIPK